ncbi:UNVERIFIED_ORG: hypothetical protein B2H98_08125 [Clostridium botulinum]|uniref:ParM/StbA family protein n=1 Tax=Clostridium sp. VAP23 TaxID=2949981 RepID=UPI000A170D6C|nr:ParM/StbA family protein [Clostridium sp. VAP23]
MERKINETNQEEFIIDLGNGVTKIEGANGKKFKFRSTVVTDRNVIERSEDTHIVNIDGVGSIIGAKDGKTFPGERRYSRTDYLHTLLTAICIGHDDKEKTDINAKIKLNLPLELYQDDLYINKLKKFEVISDKRVSVDGVAYRVNIDKVIPLPEGLLLNTLPEHEVENKRNMFLDFGYGTLDVIIALGYNIEQVKTVKQGISILYDAMAKKLHTTRENIEYYYSIPSEAIIECEPRDITDIKESCLDEYADDILNFLERLNGGSLEGINKVYFLGGGSEVIYMDFKKYIKNKTEIVKNPTYSNVEIFSGLEE